MAAGMKTILFLSFLLASGIICVILSCALFGNWLPLLVVLTYLIAPLPNAITKRLARGSSLYGDENESARETGYFMTSFFVVSGFGIPWVLYHADLITPAATILSLFGGVLIYGTVMGYLWCFKMDNDSLAI